MEKGKRDYFKIGAWNARCDVCGQKRKNFEVMQRWDGLMCCKPSIVPGCWEIRQPQDFVRGVKENMSVPWSRPTPPDRFIDTSVRPEDVDLG